MHLEQICRQLEAHGILPTIRPTRVQSPSWCPISSYLKARLVHGVQPEEEELIIHTPDILPTPGKKTFYWTMYECTNLPKKSVDYLNKAERVLVPSSWNASCFAASGVTAPISIVPLGIDPDVFKPASYVKDELIVFGCGGFTGNGRQRKGLDKIISAFLKAFPDRDDVRLHVKCSPVCQVPSQADPRIIITRSFLSPKRMARWYQELNCFINIATGGWELMAHEAMACGVPVWAPRYGGIADFLDYGLNRALPYSMERAGDIWGHGLWASVSVDDLAGEMRNIRSDGLLRFINNTMDPAVHKLDWKNSFNAMTKAFRESRVNLMEEETKVECVGSSDLTVAITSFKRAMHLDRAIQSCVHGGIKKIAVAAMSPTSDVKRVIQDWRHKCSRLPGVQFSVVMQDADLGCNELWARAAYLTGTNRLLLLHDDDFLDPAIGADYRDVIGPSMDKGNVVTWKADKVWNTGEKHAVSYCDKPPGVYDVQAFKDLLVKPGGFSLSPIVTVFDRSTLIRSISECEEFLKDKVSWLHPGMLLGTEIVAHYRNANKFKKWDYLGKTLSYFGAHTDSGTVAAELAGNVAPLIKGYDYARAHLGSMEQAPVGKDERRILLVYNDYSPHSPDEARRMDYAKFTWDFHINTNRAIDCPIIHLPRTSAVMGDDRPVPYVKDLIEAGMRHALDEDLVVVLNRDICITTRLAEKMADVSGMAVASRHSMIPQPGRLYSSVANHHVDPGTDFFVFEPQWWSVHRHKFPDMLLAREAWDSTFKDIGSVIEKRDITIHDLSYHELHNSYWIQHRTTNPGQVYNRKIALEHFTKRGNSYMVKLLTDEHPVT